MKKSNRNGFTIVELVIVIAVIAILAAVLIPTFTNLIKKANESSDVQAVRQMNTILSAEDAFKNGITINDAVAALKEAGFNGDKYVALVSGRYFFYDQDLRRIVYTEYKDGNYNVLFPKGVSIDGHALFSLSGDVAKKDYAPPAISGDTATFSIGSAEEFAQLAADFKAFVDGKTPEALEVFTRVDINKDIKAVSGKDVVITLTSNIDMKGASFNLNLSGVSFTLNGNGYTISGLVNNSGFAVSNSNAEKVKSQYGGAFLGYVKGTTKGEAIALKFENITFENCHFGNDDVRASAIFVGQLNNNATLTLNNTTVVDCTVSGAKGVAVYLGHAYQSGTQSVKFVGTNTVAGCELSASDTTNTGMVGTIIGRISGDNKSVSGPAPTCDVTIISAGVAVENASARSIININGVVQPANIVTYTEAGWAKE